MSVILIAYNNCKSDWIRINNLLFIMRLICISELSGKSGNSLNENSLDSTI